MPCPLFLPVSPLGDFAQEGMPLGDVYGGECAAQAGVAIPPDTLRRLCNAGYARGACETARGSEADAARFLIQSDGDGVIGVAWSLERDHHPVAVGTVLVRITDALPAGALERQARACAASYTRRTRQ